MTVDDYDDEILKRNKGLRFPSGYFGRVCTAFSSTQRMAALKRIMYNYYKSVGSVDKSKIHVIFILLGAHNYVLNQ